MGDDRERFRGALLGTALGDALGAPFEGRRRVDAAAVRAWEGGTEALRWTDDTAMTIALAESLVACGGFDGAHLAAAFAAAHAAEPWRGYGAGPPAVFAAVRGGEPWDEPARALFGGSGSFGNGGAMRAAPAGLLAAGDVERAAALGRSTALPTHAHELGQQGAALQAAAVAWLVADAPADPEELVAAVRGVAPDDEFQRRLDALPALRTDTPPAEVAARVGNGIAAVEAVPAALAAFLRHPSSLPDALRDAVLIGGDTDTIAAMTGALAGASLGAGAVPAAWLDRVEAADRLVALADALFDLAAARAGSPPRDRPPPPE